ncbi:MAG TPA: hypothetical protein PKK00_07465 [Bacteroidales bacterium]|nr:hypothetical protein [Bacteroidales bacterium]HPS17257.1 hypothetical protein [Bacteroidales bacterium]
MKIKLNFYIKKKLGLLIIFIALIFNLKAQDSTNIFIKINAPAKIKKSGIVKVELFLNNNSDSTICLMKQKIIQTNLYSLNLDKNLSKWQLILMKDDSILECSYSLGFYDEVQNKNWKYFNKEESFCVNAHSTYVFKSYLYIFPIKRFIRNEKYKVKIYYPSKAISYPNKNIFISNNDIETSTYFEFIYTGK